MPEILVIQWSRLGDLLQTQVLIRRILRTWPEAGITLSYDARLTPVAARLSSQIELWPVDVRAMAALAAHADTHGQLLGGLSDWFSTRAARRWDVIFVLSSAPSATLTAKILHGAEVRGYEWHNKQVSVPAGMAALVRARELHRILPVHVADIWASWARSPKEPDGIITLCNGSPAVTQSGSGKTVVVFCDAGESYRSLPQAWVLLLLELLLSDSGREVVLAGQMTSQSDDPLTLEAKRNARIRDLRGRTSLSGLTDVLTRCHVAIGPDTGGLHLAAALGIPVVGLYFGGAHCAQTGPYASKALVFQDCGWSGRTASRVIEAVEHHFQHGGFPEGVEDQSFSPALDQWGIVYRNTVSSAGRESVDRERAQFFREYSTQAKPRGSVSVERKIPVCLPLPS